MIEIFLLVVIILTVTYIIYIKSHEPIEPQIRYKLPTGQMPSTGFAGQMPSTIFAGQMPSTGFAGQMPFNYASRWGGVDAPPFTKIGFVYDKKKTGDMLDLYGRYLYSNKYEYYVLCPRTNITIPVGKNNDNNSGNPWSEIYDRDKIHIEGRSGKYIASVIQSV